MKEDYKVDPLSIKVDQTKKDTRRDAWDRDYMGYYYLKEEPKSKKQISNATPVFMIIFFIISPLCVNCVTYMKLLLHKCDIIVKFDQR